MIKSILLPRSYISYRHTIAGFVAILIWGFSIPVGRSLTEQLGPFTAGALVYLLAGMTLTALGKFS